MEAGPWNNNDDAEVPVQVTRPGMPSSYTSDSSARALTKTPQSWDAARPIFAPDDNWITGAHLGLDRGIPALNFLNNSRPWHPLGIIMIIARHPRTKLKKSKGRGLQ